MISIRVTDEQRDRINRPLNLPRDRWGGFQHLIARLQLGLKKRDEGWDLVMTGVDARAVLVYTNPSYGSGTYQGVLRSIEPDVKEALGPLPPKTGSLFDE